MNPFDIPNSQEKQVTVIKNSFTVKAVGFSLVSLALSASPVHAQSDESATEPTKQLGEVVVEQESEKEEQTISGTINKPLLDFSGSATVIGQEQIEAERPLSTIDALQTVPGVNVTTEDGRGLRPNIGIRGIDPDRSREGVLITADGVPIQPAVYGDRSAYYNVPVDLVDRIEIIKGASSVVYGPSNVGGVVNYVTKRPPAEEGHEIQLNETIREGGLYTSTAAFGVTGSNGVGTRASYSNTSGETVRHNTDTQVNDVNLRTIVPTDNDGELSLRFNYYDENVHTPGGLPTALFEANPNQSIRSNDIFNGNRIAFDGLYTQPLNESLTLETLVYANFFERNWYIADGIDGVATTNSQFLREFTVVGIEPRVRYGDWTVGTRLHRETLNDINRKGDKPFTREGIDTSQADLETVAWASYLERDITLFDGFVLTPGVRYEYIEQSRETGLRTDPELGPVPGSSGDARTQETVGSVTFNYALTQTERLYGGWQRSFEPPTFAEAVDPTTGTDTDLDSETANSYEIGLRSQMSNWLAADLTFFLLDFDNKIISEAGKLRNAGETRSEGIELGFTGTPLDRLSLDLAVTVLSSEFRNGANSGNDTPMAPEARVGWGVSYRLLDPLTVRLDGFYVGEQYTDAANTVEESEDGIKGELPDYDVWNVRGDYVLGSVAGVGDFAFYGGVNNLFDEEYRERRQATFNGIIPGLTRTFYAGIEARF